jgi:uncharacterized protein (DUF302 family)
MSYYLNKTVRMPFAQALERVREELKKEGFGVLTEIDVKDTLKKKIDVEFRNYRILGACNPRFAHEALQKEDKIGILLPCNVVVQELSDGQVEVATVDPVTSIGRVEGKDLAGVAAQVRAKLANVLAGL